MKILVALDNWEVDLLLRFIKSRKQKLTQIQRPYPGWAMAGELYKKLSKLEDRLR